MPRVKLWRETRDTTTAGLAAVVEVARFPATLVPKLGRAGVTAFSQIAAGRFDDVAIVAACRFL